MACVCAHVCAQPAACLCINRTFESGTQGDVIQAQKEAGVRVLGPTIFHAH